jgi:hypothetical protein
MSLLKALGPGAMNLVQRVWDVCFSIGVLRFVIKGEVLNEYDGTKGRYTFLGKPKLGLREIAKARWLTGKSREVYE